MTAGAVFLVAVLVSACDQPPTANPRVGEHATAITERSDRIGDSAGRIDGLAASGEAEWPDATQWRPIRDEAGTIKSESVELHRLAQRVRDADKAVAAIEAERDAALAEVERVKREGSRNHLIWLSMLGAGAIAVGVGLGFLGQIKLAGTVGGAGLALIAIAQFISAYAWLLNILAGVLLLGGIGWTVYVGYRNRKAADQLIDDIDERIKPALPEGLWDQIKTTLKGEQPDGVQRRIAERKADRIEAEAHERAEAKRRGAG